VGQDAARHPELVDLVVPRRGLDALLRGWSSDGQLFEALGAIRDADLVVQWSARDIERRAARVLLERLAPVLSLLPMDASRWREHLPVTTTSYREVASRPIHPTNWAMTTRLFGWPASKFVAHPRSRVRDESALTTLAWSSHALERLLRDVRSTAPLLTGRIEVPIAAMADVVSRELADVEAVRPDRLDLHALGSSGRPWNALATVGEAIVRAETDTRFLAFEIIEPEPDLQWRLFHLSVLGAVLAAVQRLGGRVHWLAPLSASVASGPQFQVTIGQDCWDLWFEAAGAARHYGLISPYQAATAGVRGNQRNIGADILLTRPGHLALMLECKWSAFGAYVGRDGYHQAAAYAVEARSGLAGTAWSYVVGPEEIVTARSDVELAWDAGNTVLGSCCIQDVDHLVEQLLNPRRL
jgi:hypothetical protein